MARRHRGPHHAVDPSGHRRDQLVQHLRVGPTAALQDVERVVRVLDRAQGSAISERPDDRLEQREVGEGIAGSL